VGTNYPFNSGRAGILDILRDSAGYIVNSTGVFNVLNYKGTVVTTRDLPGISNPRYINNLYASEVGKVLETYFFLNSPRVSEKRLVRYHIQGI
jgi:hypothetical protein